MTRLVLLMLLLLPAACAAPGPVGPTPMESGSAKTDEPAGFRPTQKHDHPELSLLPPDHSHNSALPSEHAIDPENLIGLLDTDLKRLLGHPDFLRLDPPAQLWQYRNSVCRFDIFLYQDPRHANAYTVTHTEARGLDVNRISGKDCFFSVLKDHAKG